MQKKIIIVFVIMIAVTLVMYSSAIMITWLFYIYFTGDTV